MNLRCTTDLHCTNKKDIAMLSIRGIWPLLAIATCLLPGVAAAQNPDLNIYPGCRRDSFFVEFPVWVEAPDEAFGEALEFELDRIANDPENATWLCDANDAACRLTLEERGPLDVRVTPVLEERSIALRDDGHRRFHRVSLHLAGRARSLSVREEALCDVVSTLRDLVPPDARVGRECDLVAMGVEAMAINLCRPLRNWHLERMGLPTPRFCGWPAQSLWQRLFRYWRRRIRPTQADPTMPTVALIDSGIAPDIAEAYGLPEPVDLLPDELAGGVLHRHATLMTLLIRQFVPRAWIQSIRVLDEQGVGITADLARGIDYALFELPRGAELPLVINLSLGWPPELGRPRLLRGEDQCVVAEDGVGEVVRYTLEVARRREDNDGPVALIAAAGNRPGRVIDEAFFGPAPSNHPDPEPCAPLAAPIDGASMFHPGQWARQRTCRATEAPGVDERPIAAVTAIGGVDAYDRPIAVAQPGVHASLVAPAEHVYTWDDHRVFPATRRAFTCFPPEDPAPLTMPAATTGTSVAAALATGAAVRALQLHAIVDALRARYGGRPMEPLFGNRLMRLLYLTGERVCDDGRVRRSHEAMPVRRLHFGRLRQLYEVCDAAAFDDIIACLSDDDDGSLAGPDEPLHARCGPIVAACAPDIAVGLMGDDCVPVELEAPGWPAGYAPSQACAGPRNGPVVEITDPELCAAQPGGCVFERNPDRHGMGAAGPQPHNPPCPDCAIKLVLSPGGQVVDTWTLVLELNADLKPGTDFQMPYVFVDGPSANDDFAIKLSALSDPATWKPGDSVVITNLPIVDGMAADPAYWKAAKAKLVVDVKAPGATKASSDTSPLRILGL